MRVLVTGGAGYIGATTAASLLAAGHEVVVVDDLRSGHRELIPDGAGFVHATVDEPETFAAELDAADACMHFAAFIEAGESMEEPERFFANNTAGALRLIDALVRHDVGRLVFSSTAALYGNPDEVPITEDAALAPTNAYGASKLLVEEALDWIGRLRGLRYASLRYFNVAGATGERGEAHDPESHLIPIVLQVAAERRDEITIFGTDYDTPDGTCVRDYVHVEDLARAHVLALEALEHEERIVCNLGNGNGFSILEVIEAAREVTGHPIPATEGERRPGDPAVLVASSERAREVLGWEPRHTDIAAIIDSAWTWHRAQWGLA